MKFLRKSKAGMLCGCILFAIFQWKISVMAAVSENPYVSYSPDGEAYTVEAGVADTEWYDFRTVVTTGMTTRLREPETGEHYYDYAVDGELAIGEWVVMLPDAKCIHNAYTEDDFFHGEPYGKRKCYRAYFSGWLPVCADCGELAASRFYYMSDNAARSMQWIDVSKAYYYKCPHCNNLEQAVEQYAHICKALSANKYYVNYYPNSGNGIMGKSAHMYNNAEVYEGQTITPQTKLSLNSYTRTGYVFVGWNTSADGSGVFYEDGAEIFNLATKEGACVSLYAQWRECNSTLQLNPGGGTYGGNSKPVFISGSFGEVYEIQEDKLVPPKGHTIHFDTGAGAPVADITGKKQFEEWVLDSDFSGKLNGWNYTFSDKEGVTDCLTAVYSEVEIVLPAAYREGYSFGGWYLDKECTRLIGGAGSRLIPGKDMALYAGWVELQLISEDNYVANQGKGAVDLSWSQKDNEDKVYLIYQKREGEDWIQIGSGDSENTVYEVDVELGYSATEQIYTVPYSGFYHLTLFGAQGGNYGNYSGGKGGKTEAGVYLEKGERLKYCIGGQSGIPGGGTGSLYGNGGGYSMVSAEQKGVLMVAGGGGGASSLENGLPGGSQAGVLSTSNGEDGVCGGGGGYLGGRAGEVLIHYHDSNCRHQHEGEACVFGGCYTQPVYCNSANFEKKEKGRTFYYGNVDDYGNHIFCIRCASDYCPGHLDIKYCYECVQCKIQYDSKIAQCPQLTGYALGCGQNENYACGRVEGEIISSKAAYGGSGYVNTEYCYSASIEAGIREGNGCLHIVSTIAGAVSDSYLDGVKATDLAAPDKIDVKKIQKNALSEGRLRISFERPIDRGTVYYHQVKSIDKKTNQIISSSNETKNTLISGVVGYYYVIDKMPETKADTRGTFFKSTDKMPFVTVNVTTQKQYLHIAPIDKAGNIGKTIHLRISSEDVEYWPLMTEKLKIVEGTNVVQAEEADCYYVRADGATPFQIEMEAYICGTAGVNYQIDYTSLVVQEASLVQEGIYSVITPKNVTDLSGSYTYPMHRLQKKVEGELCIQDAGYTVTKRFNQCKNIELLQRFTMEAALHGRRVCLIPRVGAVTGSNVVYSEKESDIKNGITLIADGQGPQMSGLEQLKDIECLDFSKGEKQVVEVKAWDDGCGLAEFYVEIYNEENGSLVRYEDGSLTGKISFEISEDNMVFNGKFSVMAYSCDRVGNESVLGMNLMGVGLHAYVERILEPHTGAFKRGESGVLYIQTTGYVERVEVYFQDDLLQEGNTNPYVYLYENPDYIQTEQKEFMVPFTTGDGQKTIKVIAYKEGTELESQPQFITIEVGGSILDELRTRLR